MLQGFHNTSHLGSEFLQEQPMCNYACGRSLRMNNEDVEDNLINVRCDGH